MNNIFAGVKIDDIHMLQDMGLALSRTDCVQPPEVKTNIQDIPGADGSADLTESLTGRPTYYNREIKMEFGRGLDRNKWPNMYSRIMTLFHGKQVKVIFDDDPNYYYTGRATVSDYKRTQTLGTLLITVNADPYKYELLSSLDDWLWDTLDFEEGIIRDYKNLVVNERLDVNIIGQVKVIVPIIISDSDMLVEWHGEQYPIVPGNNKIYDIEIPAGENVLTFIGYGTVSIDYRGGIL